MNVGDVSSKLIYYIVAGCIRRLFCNLYLVHSVGCLKPKIVLGKAILVYFFTAKSELRTIVHHSIILLSIMS